MVVSHETGVLNSARLAPGVIMNNVVAKVVPGAFCSVEMRTGTCRLQLFRVTPYQQYDLRW